MKYTIILRINGTTKPIVPGLPKNGIVWGMERAEHDVCLVRACGHVEGSGILPSQSSTETLSFNARFAQVFYLDFQHLTKSPVGVIFDSVPLTCLASTQLSFCTPTSLLSPLSSVNTHAKCPATVVSPALTGGEMHNLQDAVFITCFLQLTK